MHLYSVGIPFLCHNIQYLHLIRIRLKRLAANPRISLYKKAQSGCAFNECGSVRLENIQNMAEVHLPA
jgi:hypothetical protein